MDNARKNQSGTALDVLTDALRRRVSPFDLRVFSGAFLLALAVHLYMLTNKFPNHDDSGAILNDLGFGLTSGRWFLHPVSLLGACISAPWLNGLLGVFFLALGCLFVVKLFRIRHLLPALLMAGTMAAFPVIAATYTYMFSAFQYLFALAFAAIGAWCISKERLPWLVAGAVAVALSTGVYQAYFCFAAVLALTAYALDLCERRWDNDWKRGLKAGLKYLFALALGMVLYFIILKLCLAVTGLALTDYQGMNSMGSITLSVLVRRIGSAYLHYFHFFRNPLNIFRAPFVPMAVACMALGVSGAAWAAAKNRLYAQPANLALLVLCILLFPLASALIHVMSDAWVHLLMQYPMVVTLLVPGVLADRLPLPDAKGGKRMAALVLTGALLVLQFGFAYEGFILSNRAYFYLDMTYQSAYEYYTKLLTKIELQEGYTKATPVAMIGVHHMDSPYPLLDDITGVLIGDRALNIYSWREFLVYYMGTYVVTPSDEEIARLSKTPEFLEMPVYPDAGSIRTIDGIIVVKLQQG